MYYFSTEKEAVSVNKGNIQNLFEIVIFREEWEFNSKSVTTELLFVRFSIESRVISIFQLLLYQCFRKHPHVSEYKITKLTNMNCSVDKWRIMLKSSCLGELHMKA